MYNFAECLQLKDKKQFALALDKYDRYMVIGK